MKQTKGKTMKSHSKMWGIFAVLVVAAILCGIMTQGFKDWNPYCWFGHIYNDTGVCIRCGVDKPAEDIEQANGNVVIETVVAQGMRLNAAPATLSDEAETYTLTVTITPATADDKRVEWTVAWKNASSLWATGKTVTDYVTVTPTSENALTATVACIKDFGEQVIVTVTSLDNEEATAQCTIDYVKKITEFTIYMPDIGVTSDYFIDVYIKTSDYTLDSQVGYGITSKLALTAAFKQQFQSRFNNQFYGNVLYADAGFDLEEMMLVQGNFVYNGDPEDYWHPGNYMGLFYCFDTEYIDRIIGDRGFATRAFAQTAANITTAHATFEMSYSATYNGKVYSSGTKTVEVKFDGEALHIPVTGVSLSQNNIII